MSKKISTKTRMEDYIDENAEKGAKSTSKTVKLLLKEKKLGFFGKQMENKRKKT